MMLKTKSTALILLCLALNLLLIGLVATGRSALLPLAVYLAAVATCIAAVYSFTTDRTTAKNSEAMTGTDWAMLGGVVALQLGALLYVTSFPYHYVQDEFITGYTSYTLGPASEIHWFAEYPEPGQWIAGFPILYYALQKPFIDVLGLSLETVKLSTWPYHLLTAGLVYLLGREVFPNRVWALAAGAVYVLLAPNLYMAGYGMHNISSTFFFLAALYFAVLMVRRDSRTFAILCGLFATMGYLTYVSSYLTVPVILLFTVLAAIIQRSRRPLEHFAIVLVIVVVGLIPFATYALTHENYFTQRGDQVNAISQFYGDDAGEVENPHEQMLDHVTTNLRSLYTPGIGGVTDYWFGKQALFDWLTLVLIVAGIGVTAFRGVARRQALDLTVVLAVVATFVFGMFLTLPAGGFHRTTLAFPFIALLIVMAVRLLAEQVPRIFKPAAFRIAVPIALIGLFALVNIVSLRTMVQEDEEISTLTDSVPITEYIEENVPEGAPVHIAAFPNYHLERELIVRTGDSYEVSLRSFDEIFSDAPDGVVILFLPNDSQLGRLDAEYPDAQIVDHVDGTELRRHRIFIPPGW